MVVLGSSKTKKNQHIGPDWGEPDSADTKIGRLNCVRRGLKSGRRLGLRSALSARHFRPIGDISYAIEASYTTQKKAG